MSRKPAPEKSLEDLVTSYAEAARLHGVHTREGDFRATNTAFERLAKLAQLIKSRGAEGEEVFLGLLSNGDGSVRLWAAYDLLPLQPAPAAAELERLANGPPSPVRLNAEGVLEQWRSGNFKAR